MAQTKLNAANQHIEVKDHTHSKIYQQVVKLYDFLIANAEEVNATGKDIMCYRGYLTKAFAECDIGTSNYSPVIRKLKKMGCIEILESGARGTPSIVALLNHPSAVPWIGRMTEKPLTKREDYATLRQEFENLKQSLGGFDLLDAFTVIEKRLLAIEEKLGLTATGGNDAS